MTALRYILTALAGVAVGLFAMFLMQRCKPDVPVEPIVIHDTLTITDTFRIAGKTKVQYVTLTDTMVVRDTDTIRMEIPIEHKVYHDTISTDSSSVELGVYFEGYKAKIDSVKVAYKCEISPTTIEKKRGWGWFVGPSVQVGYGVAFGSPIVAAPYVGVGVSIGWGYHW